MIDMMRKTVERNLLKYAAGRAIACSCGQIADYRRWVIVERPDGTIAGNCCSDCFDKASDGHNLPEGYRVIRMPAKTARKTVKRAGFPTTKAALNAALRRDIFASFKRMGNCTKHDRLFPEGYGNDVELVDTVQPDGSINSWYKGDPHYSAHQVAEYVRQYCELNHLKG